MITVLEEGVGGGKIRDLREQGRRGRLLGASRGPVSPFKGVNFKRGPAGIFYRDRGISGRLAETNWLLHGGVPIGDYARTQFMHCCNRQVFLQNNLKRKR